MRVIGGSRKGHKLATAPGPLLRPTSDRVRTVLFDILGNVVQRARVLDVFAGSGSLGIEALSRGAEGVDFVEKSRRLAAMITSNIKKTHLEDHGRVVVADAFLFLSRVAASHPAPYDLILADPPYDFQKYEEFLELAGQRSVLAGAGTIALETSARASVTSEVGGLYVYLRRAVGETALLFYRRT